MNISGVNTSNFNYSFDYSDYNTPNSLKFHEHTVFQGVIKTFVVVATLLSMIFMTVLLVRRKVRNHHRGFRWYAANLMVINFIVLITIVANDKDLSFLIKSNVCAATFARFKAYNFDIIELSNIVYVSTTTFLIVESTKRYRRSEYDGFSHFQWLQISLFCDLLPLLYLVIQHEYYPYSAVKPKPYAVYHSIWWAISVAASCLFITASLCCLKKRKKEEYVVKIESPPVSNIPNAKPFSGEYGNVFADTQQITFNYRHLLRLALYLVFTMWIQYPTAYNVFADLIPPSQINPELATKMMPKVQPYIKSMMNLNIWSTFCMPLVETLACLIFLPSFGDLFCFPSESNFSPAVTSLN